MKWTTIKKIDIINSEGDNEIIEIQRSDDFYRIKNEFGNISLEFERKSGIKFSEELFSTIYSDMFSEINRFLNDNDKKIKINKSVKKKRVVWDE